VQPLLRDPALDHFEVQALEFVEQRVPVRHGPLLRPPLA
jgi:hypothetical protein